MIVYRDIFSEDEILSDSYPMKLIHGGCVWEVTGSARTENLDVDERLIGGNASADGPAPGDEGVSSSSITGINVVINHKLTETNFSKKQYVTHMKDYAKRVAGKIEKEEEKDSFKANVQGFIKEVIPEFKEYRFFVGESFDENAMTVLMRWHGSDPNPRLYFFKHGLDEEKF